jgi:stage III sporulation protein AB
MSLKYIGAVMVFIACGAIGFLKAAGFRREESCLAELIRLLDNMLNELEYRVTPLPQICGAVAQSATGVLKQVFAALMQEMESQIAPDAATCMEVALSTVKEIPSTARNMLLELGNSLGKYDIKGQMNEISAIKQQCQTVLDQMCDNKDVRLRSYKTLGLCIGAALAILFL